MPAPRNLDELRAVPDRVERIHAASAYIEYCESRLAEARRFRDEDIRALAVLEGMAAAGRLAGVSLSTVKQIRRRP